MEEPFYAAGLRFTCQRCSSCCRHDPGFVYLSEQDLDKLRKWANMERNAFIESWCRWVDRDDGYEYLCLLEKENYDCVLWEGGCLAYGSRPLQCSAYPFWSSLLADEDWWEANAQDCPGVNNGELHGRAEIESWLRQRRAEPYVRRKKEG